MPDRTPTNVSIPEIVACFAAAGVDAGYHARPGGRGLFPYYPRTASLRAVERAVPPASSASVQELSGSRPVVISTRAVCRGGGSPSSTANTGQVPGRGVVIVTRYT